jgi:hypothetical protein
LAGENVQLNINMALIRSTKQTTHVAHPALPTIVDTNGQQVAYPVPVPPTEAQTLAQLCCGKSAWAYFTADVLLYCAVPKVFRTVYEDVAFMMELREAFSVSLPGCDSIELDNSLDEKWRITLPIRFRFRVQKALAGQLSNEDISGMVEEQLDHLAGKLPAFPWGEVTALTVS